MAIVSVLTTDSELGRRMLASPAVAATNPVTIAAVVRDLLATMHSLPAGAGLAAPQIGVPLRIFVARRDPVYDYVLINPELVESSAGGLWAHETCFSVSGSSVRTYRHWWVRVRGTDRRGRRIVVRVHGDLARTFQHEMDHLDGIYIKPEQE